MGAIKVNSRQRNHNIDIECCLRMRNQLIYKRNNYYKKTGKNFEFHCCYCNDLKTLNFIEPVNYTIEDTKFTCRECFNSEKSTIKCPNIKEFSPFSTIKPIKISKTQLIEKDYVIVDKDSDSEKTFTEEPTQKYSRENFDYDEDLKLFEIGEEFTNERQIERYQNEIEALKEQIESLKSQIERDDEDIKFYRNESNCSWKMCNKLVTEVIDLADELEKDKIVIGQRKRRNSV
jgi:hypothetical protein